MLTPFSFLIVHKTYFLKKLWSPPKLFNMLGAFPARKSSFFTVEILPYDAMTFAAVPVSDKLKKHDLFNEQILCDEPCRIGMRDELTA